MSDGEKIIEMREVDVATMHDQLTSVADLHESVTAGAMRYLTDAASTIEAAYEAAQDEAEAHPVDIAIIGMSAIMPGAADVEVFWQNIVNGVNSITEVPPDRWDVGAFYQPGDPVAGRTISRWVGALDDYDRFGIHTIVIVEESALA